MVWATGACRESVARCSRIQASSPATSEALRRHRAVDLALDVEQRVDAGDGLISDRRDRRGIAAPPGAGGEIGQHEELSPGVAPAQRLLDRLWLAVGGEQPVVAGIGIGLQDTGEAAQMLFGMIARAVAGHLEQHRRRIGAAEGPVIADIDPGATGLGLPFARIGTGVSSP